MDNEKLLTLIGGLVLLVLIITAIVIRRSSDSYKNGKESATSFLASLTNTFYNSIIEIINGIDPSSYSTLIEFETDVLSQIYDKMWDFVEGQIAEAAKTDILSAVALKILNKDFLTKFIDDLIEQNQILDKIMDRWNSKKLWIVEIRRNYDRWNSKIETTSESMVEEDKKLQETFSDSKQYNEESSYNDLPPVEETVIPEEELSKLNPQTDEIQDYDPETDSSVEVVEEDDAK